MQLVVSNVRVHALHIAIKTSSVPQVPSF